MRNFWLALLEVKWTAILALLFMAGALIVAALLPGALTLVVALVGAGVIWAILAMRQD